MVPGQQAGCPAPMACWLLGIHLLHSRQAIALTHQHNPGLVQLDTPVLHD
jgi:hypothetical protein